MSRTEVSRRPEAGRALVLHPLLPRAMREDGGRDPAARLDEATALAGAIGLAVVHAEVINVSRPRPASLLGTGTLERFHELAAAEEIDVTIVDSAVTPVQQRNLERALDCKVIDRTALILEIFGARARTREGRLQVELAHLTYQRSRLVRSWTHLERQRGGYGFLGGPGESQLEIDRRLIGQRITRLKRELETVRRRRALQRRARKRVPYPVTALVGYTNAGKSTLFNRLSTAEAYAADLLFATLDPTMRAVRLPSGREIILSDTVGFISDLPTDLIAAFRGTLEEMLEADLIVHVRDISHPDTDAQKADVLDVLAGLGVFDPTNGAADANGHVIEALNKIDRLSAEARTSLARQIARSNRPLVMLSALSGEGCERLLETVDACLAAERPVMEYELDAGDGAAIAWLHRRGEVLSQELSGTTARLRVRLEAAEADRFARWRRDRGDHGAAR